jgi:hypothetical protein
MGPDGLGRFCPVIVKSIHCNDLPVSEVCAGQEATFALRLQSGDKVVPWVSVSSRCVCVSPSLSLSSSLHYLPVSGLPCQLYVRRSVTAR